MYHLDRWKDEVVTIWEDDLDDSNDEKPTEDYLFEPTKRLGLS